MTTIKIIDINNTGNNHKSEDSFDLLFRSSQSLNNKAIFVDVGAYNGDTVTKALNIDPNLKIIAIEPIKSLANEISQKFQQNKNITVINKAAWSTNQNIQFNEYEGWSKGLSTLKPIMTQLRPLNKFTKNISTYNVEGDLLDNILSDDDNISTVDYIKIDTEGSEDEVLAGFTKYRKGTRFHIESHIVNLENILQRLLEMNANIENIFLNRDPNIKDHVLGTIIGEFKEPIQGKQEKDIKPITSWFCYNSRSVKMSSEIYNREYFDGGTYTGMGYQDFPCHYNTVEFIKKKNPISVIEIGGARGYIVKKLNNINIPAICIDISEHCYHTRVTNDFILHDITKVPYPDIHSVFCIKDKQFDLCFSIATLEHIPEQHIDEVIKETARISNKGLHGITFNITPQDIDKTHCTIHPQLWWEERFKSIVPDYPVEIVDKELLEQGPISIPQSSDKKVKLNIGPFINMFHYGWVNIDKINLSNYAIQCDYIFKQHDTSNNIPYPNNSVDIIVASHFIENLNRQGGQIFLRECSRVLKSDGIIRLTIPDAELITKSYIDKTINEFRHINIGVDNSPDNAQSLFELLLSGHKTIYDFDSLYKLLKQSGFDNIQKMSFNKSNSDLIEKQTYDMYPTLSLYVEASPFKGWIEDGVTKGIDDTSTIKKPTGHSTIGPTITIGPTTKDNIKEDKRKARLKIALISTPFFTVPPTKYGGLEQIVWDLADALDELGHDVTIFAPEGSKSTPNGHLVITGPSINSVGVDWFQEERKRYEMYEHLLSPEKFDIIHDNTWFGFPYLSKVKNKNLNILHQHHGGYNWESPPPFSNPNLVAISNWMKKYTEEYFKQRGFNINCKYVYNGIDLNRYMYDSAIQKSERLLYVGRFSRFKGPHIAINVAKKANLPIDLIGGTFVDDLNYLKEIESMCNGDDITIYKDVNHDFKINKIQHAKALIVPSKMNEPFGLTCIEGMACGTAIICTRDGALPEIVVDKKTGYICDTEDQMVNAIKKIKDIDSLDCRKRADVFSRLNMALNYEKLYYNILNDQEW